MSWEHKDLKKEAYAILQQKPSWANLERLAALFIVMDNMEDAHEFKMDMATAQKWVNQMESEDGTKGPHFSLAQTNGMMANRGWHYEPAEFWAAANAMWSDGVKTAKKYGVDTPEYWADRARDFLCDKDAWPDKISRYYEYIAKK